MEQGHNRYFYVQCLENPGEVSDEYLTNSEEILNYNEPGVVSTSNRRDEISEENFRAECRVIFDSFDINKSDDLSVTELQNGFKLLGSEISYSEVLKYLLEFDSDENGKLCFEQFVKLCKIIQEKYLSKTKLDISKIFTPEELQKYRIAFDYFDRDGSGQISRSEIGIAMSQLGHNLNSEQIEKIFATLDTNKSGLVDFDEFMIFLAKSQQNFH